MPVNIPLSQSKKKNLSLDDTTKNPHVLNKKSDIELGSRIADDKVLTDPHPNKLSVNDTNED